MQTGGYTYRDAQACWNDDYIWTAVAAELDRIKPASRVFEIGCGNGVSAARMKANGWDVVAVDPSLSGIGAAQAAHPEITFEVGEVGQDLAARFGRFPVVLSVEVVEHCYSPKRFAECAFDLTEPGGRLIVTTPYHGYLKNLVLAATNRMDNHFTALWEGGHIKFFSISTLRKLLEDAGFVDVRIGRVGRIAPLAKSMVAIARRPT